MVLVHTPRASGLNVFFAGPKSTCTGCCSAPISYWGQNDYYHRYHNTEGDNSKRNWRKLGRVGDLPQSSKYSYFTRSHFRLVMMIIIVIILAEVALSSVDCGCSAASTSGSGGLLLLVLPLHGPTQADGTFIECCNVL